MKEKTVLKITRSQELDVKVIFGDDELYREIGTQFCDKEWKNPKFQDRKARFTNLQEEESPTVTSAGNI